MKFPKLARVIACALASSGLVLAGCSAPFSSGEGDGNSSGSNVESSGSNVESSASREDARKLIFAEGNPTMRTVELEEFGVDGNTALVRVKIKESFHLPEGLDQYYSGTVRKASQQNSKGIRRVEDPLAGQSIVIRPLGLEGLSEGDCGYDSALKALQLNGNFALRNQKDGNFKFSIRSLVPDKPKSGVNYDPNNGGAPLAVNIVLDSEKNAPYSIDDRPTNVGDGLFLSNGIAFPNGEYAGYGVDIADPESPYSLAINHVPKVKEAQDIAPKGYENAFNGYYQSKSLAIADHYFDMSQADWLNGDVRRFKKNFNDNERDEDGDLRVIARPDAFEADSSYDATDERYMYMSKLGAYETCDFPGSDIYARPLSEWDTKESGVNLNLAPRMHYNEGPVYFTIPPAQLENGLYWKAWPYMNY